MQWCKIGRRASTSSGLIITRCRVVSILRSEGSKNGGSETRRWIV